MTTPEPEEEEVDQDWRAEIARRIAEVRAGTAKMRSADEVLAELRELHP